MLIESRLREESLKDIGIYLQHEHNRLNSVTRPLTELEQAEYNKEKKILTMEEDLLYNLVDYLQVTGRIKTNLESGSSATTTTTTTTDEQ
ncbi:unnamed protein product [Rotaria sp. Silwood2]|nr:unnamed protein product [Rotaria sp. Silwood2]CAF4455448.1 unnamed protein product [Rotaria sp. Silwood2]CAF4780224.1 unnamed protein product [Rotaria sp. Silwood2]